MKPQFSIADLPEFFVSSTAISSAVAQARKAGRVRRIVGSLHTRDLGTPLEVLVPTRLREVIAAARPGAVLMGRSAALAAAPAQDGSVFISWRSTSNLAVPGGIVIRARRGPGNVDGDIALGAGLWMSSDPRQLLEHLERTHPRGDRMPRTYSRAELERWLDHRASMVKGEQYLNWLRDEAVRLAPLLGVEARIPEVNELIGAFLGTRTVKAASPFLRARQRGRPFDHTRVELLDILRDHLARQAMGVVLTPPPDRGAVLPFIDAYFSNFIEGTEFDFSEAAQIVFNGVDPIGRPQDAHDIRGTYRLLTDPTELAEEPKSPEHLRLLLARRHSTVMEGRPDKHPGEFKSIANRAGATLFVAPEFVSGTLDEGYVRYAELRDPFARAVFLMFLISEVHPFDDGNGRLARAMMNLELRRAAQAPVLIPTVFRNDYINALRAMTNHGRPDALVSVLDFGRRYAAALNASDVVAAKADLERTNAFEAADQLGMRLTLP